MKKRGGKVDYGKERDEAIRAGRRALDSLRVAGNELGRARGWGVFDLLGGGLISSVVKHSKINNARMLIQQARHDLYDFRNELDDLGDTSTELDISGILTAFDMICDSWIADVMVQIKINNAMREVNAAISRVQDILERL